VILARTFAGPGSRTAGIDRGVVVECEIQNCRPPLWITTIARRAMTQSQQQGERVDPSAFSEVNQSNGCCDRVNCVLAKRDVGV